VCVLHGTIRGVSSTNAGRRLLERLGPLMDQIAGALDDLNNKREHRYGYLRIHAIHMIWRRWQ
jgi:DNA-binding transcriptional LysR family regulator